jgi:glycosyltransferase involved in cell wall biosynthesis
LASDVKVKGVGKARASQDVAPDASKKPKVIACISALNEAKNIGPVILQSRKLVDEVYVCDDGSTDMTAELSKALGAIVLQHETNMGKGATIRDLFKAALRENPDVVVVLDGDGQHDPASIPDLIRPIVDGEADMVIGSRFAEGAKTDAPFYRRMGLKFFSANNRVGVHDAQSGLRAFSGKALGIISQFLTDGFGVESEELTLAERNGLRVKEVPVEIKYTGVGKTSKMNPFSHGLEIILTILRLVTMEKPLQLLGLPAFLFLVTGLVSGLYVLSQYNEAKYFSLPAAFIFTVGVSMGVMLGTTAITLYAIAQVKEKKPARRLN